MTLRALSGSRAGHSPPLIYSCIVQVLKNSTYAAWLTHLWGRVYFVYGCCIIVHIVAKGSICDQNDPKLHCFSQIPPMHPTPKVPKGRLPTPLPLAMAM